MGKAMAAGLKRAISLREVGAGDLCLPLPCLHPSLVPVRLDRKQNTRPLRDGCCYKLPLPDGHAGIFALLRRRHPANAAPPAKMAIMAHVLGSGMALALTVGPAGGKAWSRICAD